MKIRDKYKRKKFGEWLSKTGNGVKRRLKNPPADAREYMHTPPYCGMYRKGEQDAPD